MSEIPLQSTAANFDSNGLEAVKADLMSLATELSVPKRFYLTSGGDINESLAGLAASTLTTANRIVYTTGGGVLAVSSNLTFDGTDFAHAGTGTFVTGTGAVSLNGSTTIPTGKTLTVTDLIEGRIIYSGVGGLLSSSSTLRYDGSNFLMNSGGLFDITVGAVNLNANTSITSTNTFSTGTGAVSLRGNTTVSSGKTLAVTDLTAGRVIYSGTAGLLSVSANLTFDGTNFAHAGTGTFGTGTGAVSLNGNTVVATGKTLSVGDGTAAVSVILNGAAATARAVFTRTAGLNRWGSRVIGTAESGGNAGSDYLFSAYDDAGTIIDSPINILRVAGGDITFSRPIAQTGATAFSTGTGAFTHNGSVTVVSGKTLTVADTTVSTSTTTGALTVGGGLGVAGAIYAGSLAVASVTVSGLTSGRVTYATTAGLLTDSANLTFDGTNFAHGGTGTFATGTGAVSLNGDVAAAGTIAVYGATQPSIATTAMWFRVGGGVPRPVWVVSTGGVDEKVWEVIASTTAFSFRTINDALNSVSTWLSATRSGNTVSLVTSSVPWTFSNTTASTSSTTGALVVTGGVGVGGAVYGGTTINVVSGAPRFGIQNNTGTADDWGIYSESDHRLGFRNNTSGYGEILTLTRLGTVKAVYNVASTNTTTGSFVSAGGVGIGGAVFTATTFQNQGVATLAAASSAEGCVIVGSPAIGCGLVLGTHGSFFQADTSAGTSDTRFGLRPKGSTTIAGVRMICNSTSTFYIDACAFDAGGTFSAAKILSLNVGGGAVTAGGALTIAGALAGVTTLNMSGNFTQTGATTISTGTGTASMNGDVTIASGKTLSQVTTGFTLTSTGASTVYKNTTNTTGFEIGCLAGAGDANAYIYQRHAATLILGTNNNDRLTISSAGVVSIIATTASTSPTTGSLINAGGFGCAGAIFSAASTISAVTSQLTLSRTGSGNASIVEFRDATNGRYNWIVAVQYNVDNAFEITPSTAAGGSTFTTPALKIADSTGVVTIANLTIGTDLKLGNAYVATPQVPTGYIIIKDSTGTAYKVSCNV